MYRCIYVYVCVYDYVCVCVTVFMAMCVHVCFMCTYVCMCFICMCVRICICVYMYIMCIYELVLSMATPHHIKKSPVILHFTIPTIHEPEINCSVIGGRRLGTHFPV